VPGLTYTAFAVKLSTLELPAAVSVSAIREKPAALSPDLILNDSFVVRIVALPLASLIVAVTNVVVTLDESADADVASNVNAAGTPASVTEIVPALYHWVSRVPPPLPVETALVLTFHVSTHHENV